MFVFVNLCNEFQKMVFMIIINQQKQKKKNKHELRSTFLYQIKAIYLVYTNSFLFDCETRNYLLVYITLESVPGTNQY